MYLFILGRNSKNKESGLVVYLCPFLSPSETGCRAFASADSSTGCMDLHHGPENHVLVVLGLLQIRLVYRNHYSVFLILFPQGIFFFPIVFYLCENISTHCLRSAVLK